MNPPLSSHWWEDGDQRQGAGTFIRCRYRQVLTGQLDAVLNLIRMFNERTQNWEQLSDDEWFLARLRGDIISQLRPDEAFCLIPQAVRLLLQQEQYDRRSSECVQLLIDLARHFGTTEMSDEMELVWPELIAHIESFGDYEKRQAADLCRWYRRERPVGRSSSS